MLFVIYGTRGDIQPAMSSALELKRRGHDIVFCALPHNAEFVSKTGLTARAFGPAASAAPPSPEVQRAYGDGDFFKLLDFTIKKMADCAQLDDQLIEAAHGAELIVTGHFTEPWAQALAEALRIPLVSLHYFPFRKNSLYPAHGTLPQGWSLPGAVNRASWSLSGRRMAALFQKPANSLRAKLGLPRSAEGSASLLAKANAPEVQVYDQSLVPGLAEEWGSRRPFVGLLQFPAAAREAVGESLDQHSEILDWALGGAPPLYFGMGSMPVPNIDATVAAVREISRSLGQRVLIGVGRAQLSPADARAERDVKVVGPFPHDLVLPHCRAALHHGGAGTLATSLRAGLPTLVCSVAWDQPFWGAQVARLGIGAHVPYRTLDAPKLEAALRSVLDPGTAKRAKEFGARLHEEPDGVPALCDIIEKTADAAVPPRAMGQTVRSGQEALRE